MHRVFLALFLLLPTSAVLAQARTAKDCEPIQNPMEFNLCLASLSPVRGSSTRRVAPPPGASESDVPAAAAGRGAAGRRAARGARVSTTIGGAGRAGYFVQGGQKMFRYPGGLVVEAGNAGRKRMSFSVR